jgi:hypothetical protein
LVRRDKQIFLIKCLVITAKEINPTQLQEIQNAPSASWVVRKLIGWVIPPEMWVCSFGKLDDKYTNKIVDVTMLLWPNKATRTLITSWANNRLGYLRKTDGNENDNEEEED